MTTEKREPFAKVFKYGINIGGVECFSEKDDREVAKAINAAFNARVDAEVKKAVTKAVEGIKSVCEARLAQAEAVCVALADGGEMAKAILDDGFPIIHLRNYVNKEKEKAVEEFRTRAVLVAIDHPKYCHGLTVQDCCEMIADGIRALPTTIRGKISQP